MTVRWLRGVQEACAHHAGRLAAFARALGSDYDMLADLMATTERRIAAGVRQELLALTDIALVQASRARRLYGAGLRSAQDVAEADPGALYDVVSNGGHGGRWCGWVGPHR